jgi:hypothetical protein
MDPEENVRQQNAIRLALARQARDYGSHDNDDLERLAELDDALCSWLANGGFAPTTKLMRRRLRAPRALAMRRLRGTLHIHGRLSRDCSRSRRPRLTRRVGPSQSQRAQRCAKRNPRPRNQAA